MNIVGTTCACVICRSSIAARNRSGSNRAISVRSMPSATENSDCAFGAEWYIGAVTIVRIPGFRPIPLSVVIATCWDSSGVIGVRITPFGSPVVPDV